MSAQDVVEGPVADQGHGRQQGACAGTTTERCASGQSWLCIRLQFQGSFPFVRCRQAFSFFAHSKKGTWTTAVHVPFFLLGKKISETNTCKAELRGERKVVFLVEHPIAKRVYASIMKSQNGVSLWGNAVQQRKVRRKNSEGGSTRIGNGIIEMRLRRRSPSGKAGDDQQSEPTCLAGLVPPCRLVGTVFYRNTTFWAKRLLFPAS